MPPKTPRERADEKRQAKLDLIQQQIKDGTLTVRKMTPEEKKESESRERPDALPQGRCSGYNAPLSMQVSSTRRLEEEPSR